MIRPASHWRDWDPVRLAGLKKRRGIRVSLVLPARDEAATVGEIVARLRQDRPMTGTPAGTADAVVASEGGRVTELVARPLLTLHRPDLAGVVQPLGGEWAVRRGLLERIAVPTGYAVDLAVLIEAYEAAGLDGIAQVDLGPVDLGQRPPAISVPGYQPFEHDGEELGAAAC